MKNLDLNKENIQALFEDYKVNDSIYDEMFTENCSSEEEMDILVSSLTFKIKEDLLEVSKKNKIVIEKMLKILEKN